MAAILLGLYVAVIAVLIVQAAFTLRMRLFIWDEPARMWLNACPTSFVAPTISFTVLLPARHEQAVIGETIEKLCQANYPRDLLQILVICEESDRETIARVWEKLAEPGKEHVRLVVFRDRPINKPHALNVGLRLARNQAVTVFDAEDEPHAEIFQIVNTIIMREAADVVQGGVHLMNYDTRWFSVLNVLEYYFWYKSSLHYFAWSGVVPLGGNTIFIRRTLLQQLGGWDEQCLTEDAEIGIRLSTAGARIRVLCDDEHVTREETPPTVAGLIRQRSRWDQGFLQVLRKGIWRDLPMRRQRLLAAYVLLQPFMQAIFALMVPVALGLMLLVKLPIWLALFTYAPLYLFGLQVCLDFAGLVDFIRVQRLRLSWRVIATMAVAYLPYQWLMAFAAVRGVSRQLRQRTNWEKTAHLGMHRLERKAA
jgi:cellulose synthase/poly-beta-1,6-N-acetylglucosamine synthase-like glycosyltransferase